jgi:hypothetical protein
MGVPFSGGCACGALRYRCSAAPLRTVNCHCRDCQHATGSAYYAELLVPKEALTLTGSPRYYDKRADSGTLLRRGFCAACGSPVLILIGDQPFCSLAASSLDDPSEYVPEMDIYVSRTQPWDVMNPTLPKFPEMPPGL